MERRGQFKAKLNDLTLSHMDERSDNFDVSIAGAGANKLLEGLVVGRTAVGITGAVLLDGADEDLFRAQNLGPTDRCGEKMGVAEGDVGDGDRFANRLGWPGLGNGDRGVGECGAADLAEDVDLEREKLGKASVSATAWADSSSRRSVRWP